MDESLLKRIECLERRNKLLFGIILLLTVLIGLMFRQHFENSFAVKPSDNFVADTMKVNRLSARYVEVVGDSGKNSLSFSASDDGWVDLSLRDVSGELRGGFLLTPSGKLSLSASDGKVARLVLGVVDTKDNENSEEFSLVLKDQKGKIVWHPSAKNPY